MHQINHAAFARRPLSARCFWGALAAILLLAAAPAQVKEDYGGSWGQQWGPPPPDPHPQSLRPEEQAALASAHAGWQAFLDRRPGWIGLFDPRDGQVVRAFGPGYPVAPPEPSEDDARRAARSVADELLPLLGAVPADFRILSAFETHRLWMVHLGQSHLGRRVDGGLFTVRIDKQGRLVMWGGRIIDTSGVLDEPVIDDVSALGAALAHLEAGGYSEVSTDYDPIRVEPLIHVRDDRLGLRPSLAYRVDLHGKAPPADWVVMVDARTGGILQYWNDLRRCGHARSPGPCRPCAAGEPLRRDPLAALAFLAGVTGTVTSVTHEGLLPSQPPQPTVQRDIYVNLAGSNVLTNGQGVYNFNGGGATVSVSCALNGPWLNGSSSGSGTSAAFATSTGSGVLDIVFNDTNSTIGERDMVHFANKTHYYLKLRAPGITQLDFPMTGTANLTTGNCNAFYSPGAHSINFYAAASGCINTATSSTVVEHEYGHGITTRVFAAAGMTVPGYMGEGLSDCIAAAIEDTNLIGQGFSGGSSIIRNLNNTCQYPSSCGTVIHSRGLVIGGSFWHTRQQFASALGTAGKDLIDTYFFQHLAAAPQNEIQSVLEMLLLDDDDGNLANGTPNLLKFYTGFTSMHGVPFPLPLVNVVVPNHGNSRDQLQPYEIRARVEPLTGTSPTGAQLFYRIGSGAFTVVNMQSLGGQWYRAAIPNQAASGAAVEYYVSGAAGTLTGTSPAGAPGVAHQIETAPVVVFHSDGFETPSGWTSAALQGANDWHNIVHGNPNHVYDPPSAFQGSLTWGNDLVPASNWDGNYPNNINNSLTSPVINCTGRTGVTLRYRRWLTVEDGFYDQARILVSGNGGSTWTQVWQNAVGSGTQHHVDTHWVDHHVPLLGIADNNPLVRIRFQLVSDAGLTFGGWNIDDLRLVASSTASPPPVALAGTGQANTLLSVTVSSAPLDPFALAVTLGTVGMWYPGVGTMSVDIYSPSTLLLVPYAILPASGMMTITETLPPALAGVTLHFQALIFEGGSVLTPLISNVASVAVTP